MGEKSIPFYSIAVLTYTYYSLYLEVVFRHPNSSSIYKIFGAINHNQNTFSGDIWMPFTVVNILKNPGEIHPPRCASGPSSSPRVLRRSVIDPGEHAQLLRPMEGIHQNWECFFGWGMNPKTRSWFKKY